MAKKKAAAAAGGAVSAVSAAKDNPYVQRLVTDDELRDNVKVAFESAKSAYERLANGKAPTKVIMDDKKLHKDLKNAAEALRDAGNALREAPKKQKRRGGFGRKLLILFIGAGIALAVSGDLRSKVLDALFGKEEEFDYTSTTSPATSAPPAQPVSSN
jgi:hypothetical protein